MEIGMLREREKERERERTIHNRNSHVVFEIVVVSQELIWYSWSSILDL